MTPAPTRVLAVDLGATSVRVVSVDVSAPVPTPEVVYRWPHGPVQHLDGGLRWDWERICAEVQRGLLAGLELGPHASIGVDGWGVDYGLIGTGGDLLSPPYSYRDVRTRGWQTLADRIGRERLYQMTGIQLMPINTLFQLDAHDPGELDRASRLLLLPDLLVHHLTGFVGAERSNASTTALLDTGTGEWSSDLIEAVGLDPSLLPPIVTAGDAAGSWKGVPVHAVGSHDTASAFLAVPGITTPSTAVISSGTWVLVGAERPVADVSTAAGAANFSNEAGALGGVRFLKNVMGFWMLEQCRRAWGDPPIKELIDAAGAVSRPVPLVDAADQRFLAPSDMEGEVRAAAGLGAAASRAEVVRCILESIAAGSARVIEELGRITGTRVDEIFVVGGASRIGLMNELFAQHTGLPVTAGSPEATSLGNAIAQGITLGRFESLDDARLWVAAGSDRVGVAW
ncbi:MAG: rhamnulokinase [Actinomycetota bacterium]